MQHIRNACDIPCTRPNCIYVNILPSNKRLAHINRALDVEHLLDILGTFHWWRCTHELHAKWEVRRLIIDFRAIALDNPIFFKRFDTIANCTRGGANSFRDLLSGRIACITLEMKQNPLIHVLKSSAHTVIYMSESQKCV